MLGKWVDECKLASYALEIWPSRKVSGGFFFLQPPGNLEFICASQAHWKSESCFVWHGMEGAVPLLCIWLCSQTQYLLAEEARPWRSRKETLPEVFLSAFPSLGAQLIGSSPSSCTLSPPFKPIAGQHPLLLGYGYIFLQSVRNCLWGRGVSPKQTRPGTFMGSELPVVWLVGEPQRVSPPGLLF